jgi:hypothetical protein
VLFHDGLLPGGSSVNDCLCLGNRCH